MKILLFMGLTLMGCSDYMVSHVKEREPNILVYPTEIDFGHLVSGEESSAENFTVINTGDADLHVSSPLLISGNDRFTVGEFEDEYIIPAGELVEFSVGYTPETYESNGALIEILSADPDEPIVEILLVGHGDAPVMAVNPYEFDYGDISIGCDNEEHVTIRNDGNLDLTIESISQLCRRRGGCNGRYAHLRPLLKSSSPVGGSGGEVSPG